MINNRVQKAGELTRMERAFVRLFEGDGKAAVKGAGYKTSHPSAKALALLSKPRVQRAIAEKLARVESEFDKVRKEHVARVKEIEQLKDEIAEMDEEVLMGHIATRRERQVFWTQLMMDDLEKATDRLKASELLGRSETDFVERKDVNVNAKLGVIATPAVMAMLEDITGVRLPDPETKIPKKDAALTADVSDGDVILDIKALPPIDEEAKRPNVAELMDFVTGVRESQREKYNGKA